MRMIIAAVLFALVQSANGQSSFQLAPPMLKYKSGFFSGTTLFEVIFNQPGAEVRYTLNGEEPAESDPVYSTPVSITKRTVVKVKAFGKEYTPSETVTATFIKNGLAIKRIGFSKPNDYYSKEKTNVLHDNHGGIVNYRSGGWLGYDNDTVTINIELNKKEKINSVLMDLLQDENSWIFLPEQIVLSYYDESKKKYVPVALQNFTHEEKEPKQCAITEIKPTKSITAQKLKLVFSPLKKIPDWHSGKGSHGWLFIDEIKVY